MFHFIAHLMKKKQIKITEAPTDEQVSIQVQIPETGTDIQEIKHSLQPKSVPEPLKNNTNIPPLIEISDSATLQEKQKGETSEKEKVFVEAKKEVEPSLSFSNNSSHCIWPNQKLAWFIVSASATGKSHQAKQPCQDNHHCAAIDTNWGIAICCDGAGSAINSHLGSSYVANELAIKIFKDVVINNGWPQKSTLPSQEEWTILAREACIMVYNEMEQYARNSQISLSSLACTLIVVIYSPLGLMITHIGDGRGGYCNEQLEWKAAMTPHKGEEANQTIFITSDKWITDPDFRMSGKPVPESNVILEKAIAFTIMSDGCELHSFECSVMNNLTNKWYDPNTPYAKFFNPLVKNLRQMYENNISSEGASNKWRRFIESGNTGLQSEPDDKTMILGINI